MKLSLSHAMLLMLLLGFSQPSTLNPQPSSTNRVLDLDGNGSYVELRASTSCQLTARGVHAASMPEGRCLLSTSRPSPSQTLKRAEPRAPSITVNSWMDRVELLRIFSDLQASSRWIDYRYEHR